jgi:hypothetical protein
MKTCHDARSLPPGICTNDTEIRLHPVACPDCHATLHAHDIEELADGYRLVCRCGLDILSISEDPSDASNC